MKDLVSMLLQRGQRFVKYKFTSYKYEDTRSPGQSEVNVKISSETACGPVLHRSSSPVLLSDQQSSSNVKILKLRASNVPGPDFVAMQ